MDMEIFPQHSVMPYDKKNSHPNVPIAFFTVAGTRGDPPQDNILREEKSSDWHQGLLTISVNL